METKQAQALRGLLAILNDARNDEACDVSGGPQLGGYIFGDVMTDAIERATRALADAPAEIDTSGPEYLAGYAAAQEQARKDSRYNGWSNYATWNWKLWIDNDQGALEQWEERAREIVQEAIEEDKGDAEEIRDTARYQLAEEMKTQCDDLASEWMNDQASAFADLLNSSISDINWHEIAESMLDDIELFSAGWNMPGCLPDNPPSVFMDFESARDYIADEIERAADEADITEESEPDEVKEFEEAESEARKQKSPFTVKAGQFAYWVAKL